MQYDKTVRHPWDRFIKAISLKRRYEDLETYFKGLDTGDRLDKAIFEGLKLPLRKVRAKLNKHELREYKIASYFTEVMEIPKTIFENRPAREQIYIFLLLGLSDKEIAVELQKKLPVAATHEDIRLFRHYFWCVDTMPQAGVQEFARTFEEPYLTLADQIFNGDPVVVRHELGLGLDMRDIDMLRTIRDAVYLKILESIRSKRSPASLDKSIRAITNVMEAAFEVEKNMLSEDDMKPLYKCTFEEATDLETIEDMVRSKQNITGEEDRAEPPTETPM